MDDSDWYSAEVYVRGTNLLAKFSKQSGNVKTDYQYYTQNAHGDVVNLTDSTGTVAKSYKYDAFGVEQNIDDSDSNAFRYCGEYFDAETGTIYLRARYITRRLDGLFHGILLLVRKLIRSALTFILIVITLQLLELIQVDMY